MIIIFWSNLYDTFSFAVLKSNSKVVHIGGTDHESSVTCGLIRQLSLFIGGRATRIGGGPYYNKFMFREGHIFKKGDLE